MTQKRYKGIVFFLIAQILGKKNVGGGKFIGKRVLIILLSGANYGVISTWLLSNKVLFP